MNSAETFTFQPTQMKNGQDHYQAVWPWVRCSPSLILGSHVCKWGQEYSMLSHPQAKPIPDPLIPASTGSWGQGSHHTCVTIVFSLAPCPPHGELLEDPLAAWNVLVPTKSGKHRSGSLVPHRCSEHVHRLRSDDKVRYTEQCSCWYVVNLFAANNIHEKSG